MIIFCSDMENVTQFVWDEVLDTKNIKLKDEETVRRFVNEYLSEPR